MRRAHLLAGLLVVAGCDSVPDEPDEPCETVDLYQDLDGDGWGDPDVEPFESCEALDGYALQGGDCADLAWSVNPGAVEVWYDLVDQDCDGNDADRDGAALLVLGTDW